MNKGIVRQWFMQLKANNSSQQEFEKWLRFMRLVVAAARLCIKFMVSTTSNIIRTNMLMGNPVQLKVSK
jgi:hypothetical protein